MSSNDMDSDSPPDQEVQTSPAPESPSTSENTTISITPLESSEPTSQPSPTSRPAPVRQETDLKQCWICYVDETEDSPTTSRWRSPCPCALVAHEDCLLDWVADLEAPSKSRTTAPKIQCPQCKKDIHIARPRSYILKVTKAVERFGSRLVVPGLLLAVAGSLYTGATMHGICSVFAVFGRRDAERLLAPMQRTPTAWILLLPSIPVALILARTSLGQQLVLVPVVLYGPTLMRGIALTGSIDQVLKQTFDWPPSPQLAFSMLPFIRNIYLATWNRLFAKKQLEWSKAIQPRANEGTEEANEPAPANDGRLDIFNFEVEIVEEGPNVEPPAGPAPAAAAPQRNNNNNNQARGLTLTGTYISELIMGALTFPAVASAIGSLLNLTLPRTWTSSPSAQVYFRYSGGKAPKPPFLSSQWARSLVGGCLFVVVKDALVLYGKYRMARDHRLRKIRNWDKKMGRVVD